MALTYSQLPVSVADVFDSIVSTIAINLASEATLSIPTINYHCETWTELQSRLIKESSDPDTKGTRFPLVALIRNFDKKFEANDDRFMCDITLIIVTQSKATLLSEDRITTNFIPTLRPIEAELFSVIKTSPYFSGYDSSSPSYSSYESYNLGTEDTKSYKLPEYLDGIIIDKLKLKFNPLFVELYRQGPTKTLSYINNVSSITIQYVSGVFRVGFTSAQYTGIGTPTYTLFTQHNSESSTISVGGSKVVNVAGYTGEYYGFIQGSDGVTTSILYFFYKVVSGVITKYTSFVKFSLENFTLTGFTTPYYPFDIVTQTTINKAIINKESIKVGLADDFEIYEELDSTLHNPTVADTGQNTLSTTLQAITGYRSLAYSVFLDTANNTTTEQQSTALYKLT